MESVASTEDTSSAFEDAWEMTAELTTRAPQSTPLYREKPATSSGFYYEPGLGDYCLDLIPANFTFSAMVSNKMDNVDRLNPCEVARILLNTCADSWDDVGYYPLGPFYLSGLTRYPIPSPDQANACTCNVATYNLVEACGLCQGQDIRTLALYDEWLSNCDHEESLYELHQIEKEMSSSLPDWAILNITMGFPFSWAPFNILFAFDDEAWDLQKDLRQYLESEEWYREPSANASTTFTSKWHPTSTWTSFPEEYRSTASRNDTFVENNGHPSLSGIGLIVGLVLVFILLICAIGGILLLFRRKIRRRRELEGQRLPSSSELASSSASYLSNPEKEKYTSGDTATREARHVSLSMTDCSCSNRSTPTTESVAYVGGVPVSRIVGGGAGDGTSYISDSDVFSVTSSATESTWNGSSSAYNPRQGSRIPTSEDSYSVDSSPFSDLHRERGGDGSITLNSSRRGRNSTSTRRSSTVGSSTTMSRSSSDIGSLSLTSSDIDTDARYEPTDPKEFEISTSRYPYPTPHDRIYREGSMGSISSGLKKERGLLQNPFRKSRESVIRSESSTGAVWEDDDSCTSRR